MADLTPAEQIDAAKHAILQVLRGLPTGVSISALALATYDVTGAGLEGAGFVKMPKGVDADDHEGKTR